MPGSRSQTLSFVVLVALLCLPAAPPAVARQARAETTAGSAAESAIRGIVAAQAEAWNAGDGAGYGKDVAPDASFTNIFGMVMYGSEAFVARHRQILATFFAGTTKRHVIRRIRFVTPDVAIVDIDNEVRGVRSLPQGLPTPANGVLKTQLMQVFVRREGRWWVEAYHNVDAKP